MKTLLRLLIVVPTMWLGLETLAYSKGIITLSTTQNPINILAEGVSTWQMEGIRVFSAGGDVKITQGEVQLSADNAICWFYELEAGQKPEARMEILCQGEVILIQGRDHEKYEEVYLHLETTAGIMVDTYSGVPIQTFGEEQLTTSHLKLKKIKELGLAEFAYKEPLELELERRPPSRPQVVDVVANDIDSWTEGNTRVVIAIGDVEIRRAEETLTADDAILWFELQETEGKKTQKFKEFYAKGNVTIVTSEREIRKADRVFENFKEAKGFYMNPRIKTPIKNFPLPAYIGGKEMRHVAPDKYEVKDGYFTTCSFGHPHFHVSSPKVIVRRRTEAGERYTEITAYDNLFYFGDMPTAYMPVYKYDTRKKEALLEGYSVGTSTRFGTFIRTDWNPYALPFVPASMGDWSELLVNVDYLAKRGPAVGNTFEYEREDLGLEGFFQTYYVADGLNRDETRAREEIEHDNRGRVLWRHRHQLTKEWRADAELSFLSDRNFLREYFEKEFKEGKEQETYLYFRRLKDNRGATFLLKKQLHRFDTGLESLPKISYHAIGEPLWDDRLNLTAESEIAYLDFRIDDELDTRNPDSFNTLQSTTGSGLRFDTDNTISRPFRLGAIKASPFVGGRATAYSKTLEDSGPNDGPATGRFIGSLGFEASTQFWRIYGVENKLLRINGIRHIITPEFRWRVAPVVTKNPNDLLQYERLDGLDNYSSAIIGIRNRMQTRRGPPWKLETVDLLDFDVELHLFASPKEPPKGPVTHTMMTAEGAIISQRSSFLQYDLRTQVTNRLSLVSERNEFDLSENNFDVLNWGLSFRKSENWRYFFGYRFIKNVSSTVILNTDVLISKKWRAMFSEGFDLGVEDAEGRETSKNLFSNFSFTRESHDWIAGFNVSFDVVNRNKAFSFVFQPKGMKRSFGRSYSFAGR
ncbi:MAG: LPS assembly protein LptD [Candidatus Brocadiales bacterium]